MKAVIWTDVFQIFVMLSGFVVIFIHGTVLVGGPATVVEIARNGSRINFDEYVRKGSGTIMAKSEIQCSMFPH